MYVCIVFVIVNKQNKVLNVCKNNQIGVEVTVAQLRSVIALCQTKEGSKLFKDHFKVKLRCRCSVVDQIGGNKNESGIVLSPNLT